jgi:hypothetical protein
MQQIVTNCWPPHIHFLPHIPSQQLSSHMVSCLGINPRSHVFGFHSGAGQALAAGHLVSLRILQGLEKILI